MNTILENEIKRFIGRCPTEQELASVKEAIDFSATDNYFLEDVKGIISDWIDENLVECANCGKWLPRQEADIRNGSYFCNNDCADEYEDSQFDMHEEARAEYYATHR